MGEDEEKKEEDLDANCKRYDEGSHSESSQMHSDDSSSDPLASTKQEDHCESAEQQMASTSNATDCANLEANLDEENQNLIQNQMDWFIQMFYSLFSFQRRLVFLVSVLL